MILPSRTEKKFSQDDERKSFVSLQESGNEAKTSQATSRLSACVDDVLTFLGWMGPYQRLQCFLLMLPLLDSAIHSISFIFIGKFVEHKCAPDSLGNFRTSLEGNFSSNKLIYSNFSNSGNASNGAGLFVTVGACHVTVINNSDEIFSGSCLNGYEYSEPRNRSFVSEWDLVCEEEALSDTSQTVFAVGSMLGAFLFTTMADKFGRKPVYVSCHIFLLSIAVVTAFAPDFMTFLVFRFVLGALQQGVNLASWILLIEWLPTPKREWPSRVSNFVFPSGLLLLGLICYLCREMSWRQTELVLAAVSCYSLVQWCWLDESLRWLTAKGMVGDVEKIIFKAANRNGVDPTEALERYKIGGCTSGETTSIYDSPLSLDTHNVQDDEPIDESSTKSDFTTESEADPGISAFVKHKHILMVTLIICYIWLADSLSYVILIITSGSLTENFYLSYSLNILVELPAACFFSIFVSRVGRRNWIITAHLISGVSLLLAVLMDNLPQTAGLPGIDSLVLVLSLLAMFGTSVAFSILWLYTPELFPTTVRTTGLGLASLVSRFAGMVAPYARTLSRHYPWAPKAVLSGLCLVVPLLIQLMPETSGRDLPQTIADMETWLGEKPRKCKEKSADKEGILNQTFEGI